MPPNATSGGGVAPALARAMATRPRLPFAVTSAPTARSDTKIEVWLPLPGGTRKLQALGNGGWAVTIPYAAMPQRLLAAIDGKHG